MSTLLIGLNTSLENMIIKNIPVSMYLKYDKVVMLTQVGPGSDLKP